MNIIDDEFAEEQREIEKRLSEILDAVRVKDFERLAGYHLYSPKFTKFNEVDPMGRLGIDENNRVEQEELGAVDNFDGTIHELKIDVFGPVAVTTGIFECTSEAGGETGSDRIRMTLIFVADSRDWKIAHEHLSIFPSNA